MEHKTKGSQKLPLSRFALPTAHGVDQCREAVAQFLCENTVEPRGGTGDLDLHVHMAPLSQAIAVGVMHFTGGAEVRADNVGDCYSFVQLLGGLGRMTVAGREVEHEPGKRAVVMAPERPSTALSDSAITALHVRVDRSLAEAHLQAITGIEFSGGLEFDPEMPLTGKAESVWRFVDFIVEEIDRDASVLSSPLVMERLSDTLLTSLLYAQPHNYSESLFKAASPAPPSYVRRAEMYLEAHCDEPITAQQLATVVGVSLRTLYTGFQRHRRYTPMQFLRSVRLHRVRNALLLAGQDSSVSQLALRWGFTHLGRFSVLYRKHFGESPSETLRRS